MAGLPANSVNAQTTPRSQGVHDNGFDPADLKNVDVIMSHDVCCAPRRPGWIRCYHRPEHGPASSCATPVGRPFPEPAADHVRRGRQSVDKAMPIMQIQPDGSPTQQACMSTTAVRPTACHEPVWFDEGWS